MKTPFAEIIWRMDRNQIYLTFDDGPDPEVTPTLLELMHQYQISATFFVIGEKVQRHPEIVAQINQNGHTLGNHSFSHHRMLWKSKSNSLAEIARTDALLQEITRTRPVLFRPPYGRFGWGLMRAIQTTGHKMVLWNATARDYHSHFSSCEIQRNLTRCLRPGKIILLHDGHRNGAKTVTALASLLAEQKIPPAQFAALPG
ncbi:MAG: polysaccharide deacetylase family protein [bacterium]